MNDTCSAIISDNGLVLAVSAMKKYGRGGRRGSHRSKSSVWARETKTSADAAQEG